MTVDERSPKEDVLVSVFERLLHDVLLKLVEEGHVFLVHHLVAVHALSLVHPQADEVDGCFGAVWGGEENALHNGGGVESDTVVLWRSRGTRFLFHLPTHE